MEKKQSVLILLTILVLSQQFHHVSNQSIADFIKPLIIDNEHFVKGLTPLLPLLLFSSESSVNTLREIVNYTLPLLQYDSESILIGAVLPWALHNLPWLLSQPKFQDAAKAFLIELNAHKERFALPGYTVFEEDGTQALNIRKYLGSLDYLKIISETTSLSEIISVVINLKDEMFSYNSTDRELNHQCYSDMMIFIDELLYVDQSAINMFDAVGKPTMGINNGVLYFMGAYDECLAVHMVSGDTIVNGTRVPPAKTYDFNGRYCRATFDPPKSLIQAVAGEHINETHGLPLTLTWGLCLPDSCSADDIEGLLNLGVLGSWFNISVKEAHCTEDQKFEEDSKAHVVIGILGGLLGVVILCSVLDLIVFKPAANSVTNVSNKYEMSDIPMYDNMGFDEERPKGGTVQADDDANTDSRKENDYVADIKPVSQTTFGLNGDIKPGLMDITMDSDLTDEFRFEEQGRLVTLIRGFSVFTNIPTIMDTDTKPGDISCIYGIRVVSMACIILANTFLYTVLSVSEVPVAVNLMDSFAFMERWTFQPVLQASFNTDTFFLISGCLTCYWFLVRSKGTNTKLTVKLWLKFYAGRYWKMTPPYMLVLVLFVYLYMYLGQGPMWPDRMVLADKCQMDWWKHLLYISNLVGIDGVQAEHQCMPWSWYLAVNMQFYLVSPVLLTLLVYSSSMGMLLLLIIGSAGIIAAGVKESEYGGDLLTTRTDDGAYWNNIFIKPWCRIAPFCIGVALGFLIYRRRSKGKQMKKWMAALCWLVTLLPAIFVLYCQYTKYAAGSEPWTRAQDSAFEALSRPIWAFAVGWIIYACSDDFAGPLGNFLSWPGFVPLSRMTFMVYLLNPIVIVLFTNTKRAMVNINDFEMIYQYIGHLVVSYTGAFLATLVYDLPFRNIRRALQGKPVDTPY